MTVIIMDRSYGYRVVELPSGEMCTNGGAVLVIGLRTIGLSGLALHDLSRWSHLNQPIYSHLQQRFTPAKYLIWPVAI